MAINNNPQLRTILKKPYFQFNINEIDNLNGFNVMCTLCSTKLLVRKHRLTNLYNHARCLKHKNNLLKLNRDTDNTFVSTENNSASLENISKIIGNSSNEELKIQLVQEQIKKNEEKLKILNKNYKDLESNLVEQTNIKIDNQRKIKDLKDELREIENKNKVNKQELKLKSIESENEQLKKDIETYRENISTLNQTEKDHTKIIKRNFELKSQWNEINEFLQEFKQEFNCPSNMNDLNELGQFISDEIMLRKIENNFLKERIVNKFL